MVRRSTSGAVNVGLAGVPASLAHVHKTSQLKANIDRVLTDEEPAGFREVLLATLDRDLVIAGRQIDDERVRREARVILARCLALLAVENGTSAGRA